MTVAISRALLARRPARAETRCGGLRAVAPVEAQRELTLLERVAQGESSAVGALVERYTPLLWTLARRQLGNEAAEDVVQEVFLALWKDAARFDPTLSSETHFVMTVARRRIIDHRRRLGRAPPLAEEGAEPSDPRDFVDALELSDEARRAQQALARLPDAQREVLRLALVEGLTHLEIAARTALPLGTVKSHARRGLERVRARVLEPEDGGPA